MVRRVVPLILAVLALVGMSAGYRATLTSVTLVIDGASHSVRTHQPTVSLLLTDLDLSLRPEDQVKPGLDMILTEGTIIEIQRARPVVLVVDGRERTFYAHDEQPADLLAQYGISLSRYDAYQIRPPLATDPVDTRHRIVVQRAAKVILDQGATRPSSRTTFYTTAATVGEALLEAGIRLYRADKVFPDPATPIFDGMHIQVQLSLPISVRIDDHTMRTRTHRARVGEVLADLGITLNGQDYAVPPLDASLQEGLEIQVVRVTESVIVEQSSIPFEVVWQPDPDSEIDTQRLLQEGEPGVLERRIRLRYEDGRVVDRWVEGESVVLPPSNRVMGYGTKIIVRQLSTPSGVVEYWRVLKCLATSYSASTSGVSRSSPSYGRTATGRKMGHGIVAVDPNVIPLGTRVYVPGYGVGLAADTGGAIWGKRIDLGYDDSNLELWYAWVDVYLLAPPPSRINSSGPEPMEDPRVLLRRHGLHPRKSLGQNFLVHPSAAERIVAGADVGPDDVILEVGAGLGTLTRPLATAAGHVFAVETDPHLVEALHVELADQDNLSIVHEDILRLDPTTLLSPLLLDQSVNSASTPLWGKWLEHYKVVANLPYYITSAVIQHLLEATVRPSQMVITVQREVAKRMVAKPGDMSLLAVSLQFYAEPRILFYLKRGAFYPVPKVESAVIRLDLYETPPVPVTDIADFFRVVKAGFAHRRKQLRNTLAATLRLDPHNVEKALKAADLDPRRRAETLSIAEWGKMLEALTPLL